MWGVRGRALSHARPPVLRACGRGPLPTGCGCRGCGSGDPSPTAQRVLLRAGFAGCGGGTRAPRGRVPLAWLPDVRGWALSHGRPPVPRPCGRGPLPNGCGCGGCGRGDPSPIPQRASLRAGSVRCGGGTRASEGGVPLAECAASRPGPATHWLWMRGVWAGGPVTNSTARASASWLCALWGRHEGAVRGECLLPRCAASGVGHSPRPNRPSFGRAAGARYQLAVGAGGEGVGTRHQHYSPRSDWTHRGILVQ